MTADAVTVGAVAQAVGGRLSGSADVTLTDATHDSRLGPDLRGDSVLFCCVPGGRFDGHDFAERAVRGGAAALLVQRELRLGVPEIVVQDVRRVMGRGAALIHGRPSGSLDVIGVTGTNGKTTVVAFASQILGAAGRSCSVIGTLTSSRTTPESTDLQRMLHAAVDRGDDSVAMEVSSHALDLYRVEGVEFAVAVFTNLGRDHLDHHGTMERYFDAKARLFEPGRAATRLVNLDDVHGRLLMDSRSADRGISLEDLAVESIGPRGGSRFTWRGHRVTLAVPGSFNVTNALLAAEACVSIGVDVARVADALGGLTAPPGRFEAVDAGQPFAVVVDYAHTPDALENLLGACRTLTGDGGRLIVVFGCGGDRDRAKRPRMGEVADRMADVTVITSDNPRSEDPSTIMAAVRAGFSIHSPVLEPDRRSAIELAVSRARADDVVVIAGKGHETTQTTGERVEPFDDRVVAAEAVRALGHDTSGGGR